MKKIVITGASVGIGAEVARRFSKEGDFVVLLARRYDKLKALKEELGKNVAIYELDVTSKEAVEKTFAEIGPLDILVNNAGGAFGLDKAYEANLEDWDKCVDTNIKGLMYCTRAALPFMVKQNSGHIINLGSTAGIYPYPGGNVYGGAKAFVEQFSLNLKADLLGTLVRVTCVMPGAVEDTEFSQVRFHGDDARAQKVYEGTLSLKPEDIADVIYYCASVPVRMNINSIEIMPVYTAPAPLNVYRKK